MDKLIRNNPPLTAHSLKRIKKMTARYGYGPETLMATYNPDNQRALTASLREVHMGPAPRLITVSQGYGFATARSWLKIQLNDLSTFIGVRQPLTVPQLHELSEMILADYGHLRISELMLFFQRFKRGHYGEIYGTLSPVTIFRALDRFANERIDVINRFEREDRAAEFERHISQDEALRTRYATLVPNAFTPEAPCTYVEFLTRGLYRLSPPDLENALAS